MAVDKPCWAESLQPRGVYFEGFVDDVTATVERYKAETLTNFGTRTPKLSRDDPERSVSSPNTQSCIRELLACLMTCYLCSLLPRPNVPGYEATPCHGKLTSKFSANNT